MDGSLVSLRPMTQYGMRSSSWTNLGRQDTTRAALRPCNHSASAAILYVTLI